MDNPETDKRQKSQQGEQELQGEQEQRGEQEEQGGKALTQGNLMAELKKITLDASGEQTRYASVLEKGMLVGLATLFITFLLYVTGLVESHIPLAEVPNHWSVDVETYLSQTGLEGGWSWVLRLRHADFLNFIGIAILAGVTVLCYVSIIPLLWKKGDRVYVVFAALEVIVLTVAASGVLGAGGH